MKYYAVKKVFVKFFAKFFEVFYEVFQSLRKFLRFSRAFRGFRIHSDPLGCIRTHSEAIGRVWTFSKILRFFGFLSRFSTFPDVIFTKVFFHGTIRTFKNHPKCHEYKNLMTLYLEDHIYQF